MSININPNRNFNSCNPSFGSRKSFVEKGIEGFAKTQAAEKFCTWGAKTIESNGKQVTNFDKTITKVFPPVVAIWMSSLYLLNTVLNKSIEKERKPVLMANMGIVCGFSTVGGAVVNKAINNSLDNFIDKVEVLNKGLKDKSKVVKGLKIAMPIMIFSTMYRYIGPVLANPLAAKLTDKFFVNKQAKQ